MAEHEQPTLTLAELNVLEIAIYYASGMHTEISEADGSLWDQVAEKIAAIKRAAAAPPAPADAAPHCNYCDTFDPECRYCTYVSRADAREREGDS